MLDDLSSLKNFWGLIAAIVTIILSGLDDVLTSGATANACVGALLQGGAQSVRIACFARVVDGESFASPMDPRLSPENETPEIR